MLSHFALDPGHAIAGLLCFNDETTDSALSQPKIRRGKHQGDIGILARGYKLLCSINNVGPVTALGPCPDRTCI